MPLPRLEFRLSTVLSIQGVNTPLTVVIDEPIRWDAVRISAERDVDFHGVNYEYSDGKVQLDFQCESGVNLLTTQYQTFGNDAVVKFLLVDIAADDSETIRYSGKLDFNDCEIEAGKVSADVVRDDLNDRINSRWDSPVSMTVAKTLDNSVVVPPKPIEIGLPGQALTESGYYKRIGPWNETSKIESPDFLGMYTLLPNLVSPDGKLNQPPGTIDPLTGQPIPALPELQALNSSSGTISSYNGGTVQGLGDTLSFIDCKTAGTYKLVFDWVYRLEVIAYKKATAILNAQYQAWSIDTVLIIDRPNKPVERIPLAPRQTGQGERTSTGLKTIDAHYNGSFEVTQGTRIYLFTQIHAYINARQINFNVQTLNVKIQITRTTRAVDSKGYAFMLPDALKHVFGVVSNALVNGTGNINGGLISKASADQAQDGYGTEYAVSSGFQLRNLATKSPTFTLKELIGALSAQHAAGLLYETDSAGNHSVRVEAGEWFYRGGQIMVLDEVENEDPTVFSYSEKPNKDLLVNQVIVGYDKFPDTGPGVLNEFNTTRTYQTPIITNQLTKEIKCPLIAAGSAIEEARRLGIAQYDTAGKLIDNSTEGGTYDDDNFILHVAPKSASGLVIFTVLTVRGFPFKVNTAAKQFQLPDDAEPLKVGDIITFSGTGTPNDGVAFTISAATLNPNKKRVYSVGATAPLVDVGAVAATWTLANQPVRIRTNERLDVFGITDPATTYNLELSPARMLRRWAGFINSGLRYKKATDELRCTDYKNNRDMNSRVKPGFTLPGDSARQIVYETGNIALGEFDGFKKIFSPEVITATVYMTRQQVEETLLACRNLHSDDAKNMGYLTIRNPDGNLVDGFLMKLSYNPNSEMADLTLNKKFVDNRPGGVDCTNYNDWVYHRFENDLTADPDLYRFCRFQDFL